MCQTLNKTDLQKAVEFIDSIPPAWKDKGPFTAIEDENGVIHLQDQDGVTHLMMDKETYQSMVDYESEER